MDNPTQKKGKTSDEIDRISQFPDEILHHILSFVEIFDVAGLSVLSRRWRDLWIKMPYLDFDTSRFYCDWLHRVSFNHALGERFRDLINWVLIYRGSTNITRFRLCCSNMFDRVQIMRWIRAAARRNVQEFELNFQPSDGIEPFELPYSLITCESLRVLKLCLSWCVLHLPSSLKFKQLTSLYLDSVELVDEDLTRSFFSGCSLLEDLTLKDCDVSNMMVLDITSSSLKCLTINSYCHDEVEDDFYGLRNCEIRISCPNLLSFTYRGLLARNYCLDNLSSLENVCINLFTGYGLCSPEEVGHQACKILGEVENIRVLKLHFQVMSIQTKRTKRNKHWQLPVEGHTYWESRLKSVRLINFAGEGHELRFVKFMLKNGLVLEEFIVFWSKDAEKSLTTEETVLKFPKASSLVVVNFLPK